MFFFSTQLIFSCEPEQKAPPDVTELQPSGLTTWPEGAAVTAEVRLLLMSSLKSVTHWAVTSANRHEEVSRSVSTALYFLTGVTKAHRCVTWNLNMQNQNRSDVMSPPASRALELYYKKCPSLKSCRVYIKIALKKNNI